ncbi:MAG: DUF1361 domain-containing protein [Chitinophagales bacterium]
MLKTIRSKYFKEHWEITLMLLLSSAFAVGLEILRILLSHHKNYFYFIWNLFLAWVPFLISMYLPIAYYKMKSKFLAYVLLIIWILFWPNSPYILTDLLHLREKQVPLWYDLGLILSFAWAGLMLGFISLIEIQNLVRKRISRVAGWIFAVFILLFGSLGIYVGRYERLNSWDVLDPDKLFSMMIMHLKDQPLRIEMLGMTLLYFIFLLLGYLTVKVIIKIPDRMAL